MLFLVVLTVVAMLVAVGALQNGQAVTVSFFFWQFQSPLALIILTAAAGGVAIGILVGWARAIGRWRRRPVTPAVESEAKALGRSSTSPTSISGASRPESLSEESAGRRK